MGREAGEACPERDQEHQGAGGLNIVCIRSKADALFLRQICRIFAEPNLNSCLHLKFWVGLNFEEALSEMGDGDHANHTPASQTTISRAP